MCKLGYGGTKEEMARLIKEASEMKDVQERLGITVDASSMSFDNISKAIHVVQENMGIAGATADEAATTFSGSMASMLAAGKNLIANLTLGEDIGPALKDLATTTWTFAKDNLLPMVWNIIKGVKGVLIDAAKQLLETDPTIVNSVIDSILSKLPELFQQGTLIVSNVLDSISSKAPDLLNSGVSIVSKLVNGILQNIPSLLSSAGTMLNKFLSFIMQNLPTILQAGSKLLLNLVQGIISNLPKIISTASTIVSNLLATFAKNLPQLLQQGISMLGQLAAGLIRAIPSLIAKIPTIITNIKNSFTKFDWNSIGKDIITGVAKGIASAVSSIVKAAKDAAKSAFNAAKKALGIKSPSKVMRDGVGRWIPAGIAVGIERNASMVSRAMNDLSKEASGSITADLAMGINQSRFGSLALANGYGAMGGFQQNVNIYSPKELSPSEVARQTRNATRNMVLALA